MLAKDNSNSKTPTRRHEWKAVHGFRKYYKSRAEKLMKPINVGITMGHDIGYLDQYWRPRPEEILEDYLKAEQLLTINADEYILQKQVQQLKEKNQVSDNSIKRNFLKSRINLKVMKRKDYDVIAALFGSDREMQKEIEKLKTTRKKKVICTYKKY